MNRNTSIAKVFLFSALVTILISSAVFARQDGGYLISGSYTLASGSSSDAESIIRTAANGNRISAEQRADLRSKLSTPGRLEIDVTATTVTLRTPGSNANAVFQADGVARDSQRADGTPVSVRVSFSGQVLIIASVSDDLDYSIIFDPIRGGRQMRVTRRVTASYLSNTVTAQSVYDKQGFVETTARTTRPMSRNERRAPARDDDAYARVPSRSDDYGSRNETDSGNDDSADPYGGYSDSAPADTAPVRRNDRNTRRTSNRTVNTSYPQRQTGSRRRTSGYGNFAVPGGTVIAGRLESLVTTQASQERDPFRITVESPAEFRGAVIEGYLTGIERTGKVTGRSAVTFNFESIVLRDGRRYDFAGVLQQVVDRRGEEIRTNDEGEVTGKSRTKETVKRSGIGAGIGAIIGGLLGGGKGALIGASIGAGAGAGSMIPGGRDDLEIEPGARMTIRSTGPGT